MQATVRQPLKRAFMFTCTLVIVTGPLHAQEGLLNRELLEGSPDNSGIRGEVSRSFDIAFGDDRDKGRVPRVHYSLTYNKVGVLCF